MITIRVKAEDGFIWECLRDSPGWVVELVEDGEAFIFGRRSITIKYKNGYATADKGDMIIRHNKDSYTVIRKEYLDGNA